MRAGITTVSLQTLQHRPLFIGQALLPNSVKRRRQMEHCLFSIFTFVWRSAAAGLSSAAADTLSLAALLL
jgi:hypothetical protein